MGKDEIKIKKKTIFQGLLLLLFLVWIFWPSEGPLNNSNHELEKNLEISDQFSNTSEPHWGHMPLTYNYDEICQNAFSGRAVKQIETALNIISNKTNNSITFSYENTLAPDLMYYCDYDDPPNDIYGEDLLGEELSYTYETKPLVYSKAEIFLYSTFYKCSEVLPAIHIHETLHALGLDHPKAPYTHDIMSEYYLSFSEDCNLEITPPELAYLNNIYGRS